ncbi:MAG: LTA synthase family protein [bacterium]|nr:LTA synthase family protein [bacterium]
MRRLLIYNVFVGLIFFLLRLVFCLQEKVAAGLYLNLLATGFFQDLFVLNVFTLLVYGFNKALRNRISRTGKWLVFGFNNLLLFLYLMNIPLFHILQININFRMLNFLDELHDLAGSIGAVLSPWLMMAVAAVYLLFSFVSFRLIRRIRILETTPKKNLVVYLCLSFILGLLSEGIKLPDLKYNQNFRRNIFISILHDTMTDIRRVNFKLTREDILNVQKFLGGERTYGSFLFPFLSSRKKPADTRPEPYNIVIIVLESFRMQDTGMPEGEPAEVTPFFNSLSRQGLLFTRFYSSGVQTAKGLVASHCSVLTYHGDREIKYFPDTKYYGLGNFLNEHGYRDGLFLVGENPKYDKMDTFFRKIGYGKIIGLEAFPASAPRFGWGVHDEALFDKAVEELDRLKPPFYVTLLTTSNHHPYELPDKRFYRFSRKGYYGKFLAAMSYSDWALSCFFRKIRNKAYFSNTIFILFGDHGESTQVQQETTLLKKDLREENIRVPLLIYAPATGLKPGRSSALGSLVDILPTLCDLIRIYPDKAPWVGQSLFRRERDAWAFSQNSFGESMIAVMWKDYKLVYNFTRQGYTLFRTNPEKAEEKEIPLTGIPRQELEYYQKILMALYKVNNSAVIRNRIYF